MPVQSAVSARVDQIVAKGKLSTSACKNKNKLKVDFNSGGEVVVDEDGEVVVAILDVEDRHVIGFQGRSGAVLKEGN